MMPHTPYWPAGPQWLQAQQQVAVSAPRHRDINFQQYLQAQIANWRPFVSVQQPTQLQTRHAPYGRLPPQQRLTMEAKADFGGQARLWPEHDELLVQQMISSLGGKLYHPQSEYPGHQSSFFNDEIEHRPEENTLFNFETNDTVFQPGRPAMDTLTQPFNMPGAVDSNTQLDNGYKATRTNSFDQGLVTTYVDPSQYQPVCREDWNRASIDFNDDDDDEADSPASLDTYSNGPITPVDGGPFMSIVPRFGDDYSTSFSSTDSTVHYANRHHNATNNHKPNAISRGYGPSNANATTLQYTGLPISPHLIMPFDHYAPSSTNLSSFRPPPSLPSNDAHSHTRTPKLEEPADVLLTESALRRERDDYLLSMRDRGLSYREIKRRGKFREAESTLRGRVRVLTKDKSERVRRPEWTDMDVRLLKRAVAILAKRRNPGGYVRTRDAKPPWKRVSAWIRDNGGTYLFAPATCAKKWEEIGRD